MAWRAERRIISDWKQEIPKPSTNSRQRSKGRKSCFAAVLKENKKREAALTTKGMKSLTAPADILPRVQRAPLHLKTRKLLRQAAKRLGTGQGILLGVTQPKPTTPAEALGRPRKDPGNPGVCLPAEPRTSNLRWELPVLFCREVRAPSLRSPGRSESAWLWGYSTEPSVTHFITARTRSVESVIAVDVYQSSHSRSKLSSSCKTLRGYRPRDPGIKHNNLWLICSTSPTR